METTCNMKTLVNEKWRNWGSYTKLIGRRKQNSTRISGRSLQKQENHRWWRETLCNDKQMKSLKFHQQPTHTGTCRIAAKCTRQKLIEEDKSLRGKMDKRNMETRGFNSSLSVINKLSRQKFWKNTWLNKSMSRLDLIGLQCTPQNTITCFLPPSAEPEE